jgi:hypothetical protein
MTKKEIRSLEKEIKSSPIRYVAKTIDGKPYRICATKFSANRYCDGIDWIYFEFLDPAELPSKGRMYHDWALDGRTGDKLIGWLIPAADVAFSIKEC